MNVLLIDNATKRIKQIQEMLTNYNVDTVGVWELKPEDFAKKKFDFMVLSGGNFARAFSRQGPYSVEMDLIKHANIPIFGICMGMQLIVDAFTDYPFAELRPRRRGVIKVNYGQNELDVFENHKWAVEKVTDPLEEISRSEDGIEIVKHKTKPIWGVQFHPEADAEFGTNGKIIFDEFIRQTL